MFTHIIPAKNVDSLGLLIDQGIENPIYSYGDLDSILDLYETLPYLFFVDNVFYPDTAHPRLPLIKKYRTIFYDDAHREENPGVRRYNGYGLTGKV